MFTADHIANEYAKFKGGTEKAENNKRSILRHLELGSIDDITSEINTVRIEVHRANKHNV